jgi:FkbM family methyltransferase
MWRQIGFGIEMLIDPADYADQQFYLGTYDPTLVRFVRQWVIEGDTCLDVGAQKGYVSLIMGLEVGKEGRVLAFEPDDRAYYMLSAHLLRNKQMTVTTFPIALGATDAVAELHLSNQLGWSSIYPNALAQASITAKRAVNVRSIDSMITSCEIEIEPKKLSFAKIDCEGSECATLAGMRGLLERANPVMWIEANEDSLRIAGESSNTLVQKLIHLGFSVFLPNSAGAAGNRKVVTLKKISHLNYVPGSVLNLVALRPSLLYASADRLSFCNFE